MTERILVADDNAAKRYVTARWLQQAGYTVEEATTGGEALRRARSLPALIIMDVRLPDMSGFEVVRRIKSDPRTAHIPVLHLSAHVTSTEDRVFGLEGGADGYLTHPVQPEELRATISALLRVRRAEGALRSSEERYRLVARATNDVIWDWDLVTGEVHWNSAVQTMFRYSPTALRPELEWWHERIHPDDRDRVIAGQQAVIGGTGDIWTDEYRFMCADGTYATVFDRGYVLHDDQRQPVRMIGSMLDVTARKRAEDQQHLLADAGTVLASSLDYETTMHSLVRLVVPRVADWCVAYVHDEVEGVRLLDLAAADPSLEPILREVHRRGAVDFASPTNAVARSMRTGAPELFSDVSESLLGALASEPEALALLRTLDVKSVMIAPMTARGRTLGTMLFVVGESGRRYGRGDLPMARELATRAALAMDNARLYDSAMLANSAKSDFLAVMSHELRTPLNAVVGYSDLMLLGIPAPLPQPLTDYAERIQGCARHLLGLIEQILTFSRVEAGQEDVRRDVVDLEKLLSEVSRFVAPLAERKGLRFEVDVLTARATVRSDAAKLRQILINLLTNSVKFTEKGTVRLRLEPERDGLAFRVEDTGIGISPENLERIFDPFWQVEQRRTRTVGGAGIGLTVSRRLAQLLGGAITVASSTGHGSTFVFHLPLPEEGNPDADGRVEVAKSA